MPEWGGGRTTLEMIVQELQHPVRLDESFERRVMVRVRRLHAERRSRGWVAVASRITHRPGWAAALAASVVAVVTIGLIKSRPDAAPDHGVGTAPVQFVLVAPNAHSVAVVGDFNNWGLNDSALVATNHEGVWSVTAPVPAGVHRYAFVVNGKQWVADPSAPRSTDDDFGMPSSALVVEDSAR
ncbi:MAG TPA: isoamylase early set domain-containing protein [Gemmatimonadaceae bacterium]|nr:isoamylase early set domain-containing protein [Gemmatimonadaceae bacterium]